MLDIKIDDQTARKMLEDAINKHVDELAKQKYFMTYAELAKYLNISKPIIEDRLIKNGMKFYRIGSKYLFKRSEVDQFLDEITFTMTMTHNDLKFFNRVMNKKKVN